MVLVGGELFHGKEQAQPAIAPQQQQQAHTVALDLHYHIHHPSNTQPWPLFLQHVLKLGTIWTLLSFLASTILLFELCCGQHFSPCSWRKMEKATVLISYFHSGIQQYYKKPWKMQALWLTETGNVDQFSAVNPSWRRVCQTPDLTARMSASTRGFCKHSV